MWGSAGWLDKGEDPRWGVELAHNRTTNTEVFMSHTNAVLTPTGRLRLAKLVVDDGWVLRRAAARFGVSVTTARRWSERYRLYGRAGMVDRAQGPEPLQLSTASLGRPGHRVPDQGLTSR